MKRGKKNLYFLSGVDCYFFRIIDAFKLPFRIFSSYFLVFFLFPGLRHIEFDISFFFFYEIWNFITQSLLKHGFKFGLMIWFVKVVILISSRKSFLSILYAHTHSVVCDLLILVNLTTWNLFKTVKSGEGVFLTSTSWKLYTAWK